MAVEMLHSIFYGTVLQNSTIGAVFVLFILLFRKMTERLSKGFVRILWILLLAELLTPPLLHGSLYTLRNLAMNVQIIETDKTTLGVEAVGKADALELQDHVLQKEGGIEDTGLEEKGRQLQPAGEISFMKGLVQGAGAVIPAIWLAGAFCLCVIYLCRFLELQKKTADAVFSSGDGCWVAGQVDMPFVMPYIRPRIYLPESLADSVRTDVLSHERQHIKNLDPLIKCLAAFAVAVHWFNPFVWIAYVFMGKDLEMYCDERVMHGKSIEERKRYSNTLLEFASRSSGLTVIMHFGESNTEHRIRHILYAKKPRFAVAFLLAVIVGVSGIFFLTAKKAEGKGNTDTLGQETEALLAEKIQERSSGPLIKKCFADFDGDGTGEMFAVTGETAEYGINQIWYASPEEVTCLMDDSEGYTAFWQDGECIYTVNGSQKLFAVPCGTGGSNIVSKCYYVMSGTAYEVHIGAYLEQLDGEDFAVYPDAYDNVYMDGSWSGHTRKAYYLKWTGSGFEEYTAKEISIDELGKYDGSENVLKQIKGSGYEISSVYLRSNGIININVTQDFDQGRGYENVTLKIEDGEVYVVSADPARSDLDARDILEVSSYGGIYKESGFYVQEEENGAGSSTQEESVKAGAMTGDGREGHGYYEELIAVAGECAIKNNGEKPEGYDFSDMLYMVKNWDYGTLGYLIKDIDGNGTDELIFGGNADNRINDANAVDKRTAGYKRRRLSMQKGTEAMLELLKAAKTASIPARYVLFDSWFFSPGTLHAVKKPGYDVIGMVKKTPKMFFRYNDEDMPLTSIYQKNRKRRGKSRYLLSVLVEVVKDGEKIPAKVVYVRNRNKRKEYLCLISTDTSLDENEIIRIYGKRWDTGVFFKICKSYLNLGKECNSLSYDALSAHTAVVFTRYMMLSLENREGNDTRSLGELFLYFSDEMSDITWVEVFQMLLEMFRTILAGYLELSEEKVNELVDAFMNAIPAVLKSRLLPS